MAMLAEIFLAAVFLTIGGECSGGWSYTGDNGPTYWKNTYPACALNKQSPIDLKKTTTTYNDIPKFTFTNYNVPDAGATILNNGHSVVVTPSIAANISGGGLGGTYRAAQLHFHWGSNNRNGSEHTVNGGAYPMEMHIVHYNTKYDSLTTAATKPDGLAVLGFFYLVDQSDNPAYSSIVIGLGTIKKKSDNAALTLASLKSLFKDVDTSQFYRYSGSLTTPGCFESVTWTVFREAIKISSSQLQAFRSQTIDGSKPLVNNYRPTQPQGTRTVKRNFPLAK